ncbi:hypothetical protein Patl1_04025 [Pistacia atlantica]|uniref:Uncharacterized protein n=1 Tax=Pistacia atlantica TaxID=434234 RepID=A0ACC1BRZ6_9ROSI|nr:hypothetical protein Patl1_04025 [Pistacia atlantica]
MCLVQVPAERRRESEETRWWTRSRALAWYCSPKFRGAWSSCAGILMAVTRGFADQRLLNLLRMAAIESESEGLNLHNISFYLAQPTSALMTAENIRTGLKNLEFHNVQWEIQLVSSLGLLLDISSNVKQIVFNRNKFDAECLTEISDVIKRNKVINEIMFSESGIRNLGASLLADALKVNDNLEELQIWEDSIGFKATPLISAVLARNRGMEVHVWSGENGEKTSKVVEFVPENFTLRIYRLDVSGACRVACALGCNTTVKSLDLTGVRLKSRWAKEFRWVLEQHQTLKEVILSKTCLKDKGVVYVSAGLFKNQRLESLYLHGNWFSGIGVEHLLCPLSRFSALQCQANITLKSVTFGGIYDDESLRPDDFVRIFKSLHKNASLRQLSLQGCRGIQGKADGIYQKLGQKGKSENEPETDLLKDMPLTEPKSCRVFFCGQEYAGKNTLCNSVSQNFSSSSSKLPYLDQVRTLVNPVEQAVRTVGMKIKTFKDEDTKISIWNLAGQHEFYSLHDLMFPGHGSASFFLIISSLFRKPTNKEPKTPEEVEKDLQYWLRSSASVTKLTHHIRKTSKTILQRVPRVYQLCNDLIQILSDWRSENYNKPAMKWKEFDELCQVKVPPLRIRSRHENKEKMEMRRRVVATCLHHIGEVIYFNELGFLILDCEWFCGEVLSKLVKLEVRRQSSAENNGFISRKELEKILRGSLQSPIPGVSSKVFENLEACDLVRMMLKLELCYEQDPSDPNSLLLIPSILEEGRGKPQRWQISSPECLYAGRHLECDDSSHMFLTPGFFPRLQARLLLDPFLLTFLN